MATQFTIIKSYSIDETLVTEVRFDYTEDLEDSVTVEIYHFQPVDENEIAANISNRGISEKTKILARKRIESILINGNLNGG